MLAATWTELEFWRWPITVAYVLLVLLIGVYGLHRYFLVFHWRKHRREIPRPKRKFEKLPRVTVQLPLFNEGMVAERVIDATACIEYPEDRLQIQVLDDSTDGSEQVAEQRCAYWRAKGLDIEYTHRTDRTGFKAGALANGLKTATGEFVAIFDADFVPHTSFLKRTIHFFTDPKIGMVQTRWDHLNRDDSLLTRSQAIFLDGHFVIEHTARHRSGRWFNFSGTGGVWRTKAIQEAGGWSHDTLTEDMDLSYRAQLAGWNFLFLPKVTCPAELPPEMNAFKSQQHRWTKGSIQVAKKLLPRLLRSKAPRKIKTEAFFHLTSPLVYLYINLFVLLFYPAIALNLKGLGASADEAAAKPLPGTAGEILATKPMINPPPQDALPVQIVDASSTSATWLSVLFGLSLFAMGAMSASVFYMTSQRILKRGWWASLAQIPLLMSVGIGIALNNAIACVEALIGHQSDFVRTPKYNLVNKTPRNQQEATAPKAKMMKVIPIPSLKKWTVVIELAFGLYMLQCTFFAVQHGWRAAVCIPFLLIFATGYLYVGISSAAVHIRTWMENRRSESDLQPV
ncbi:MAG: glycosyltransferase [Planctomycetota bacterium]